MGEYTVTMKCLRVSFSLVNTKKQGSGIVHTTEYNSTAADEISENVCSHLSGVQADKRKSHLCLI